MHHTTPHLQNVGLRQIQHKDDILWCMTDGSAPVSHVIPITLVLRLHQVKRWLHHACNVMQFVLRILDFDRVVHLLPLGNHVSKEHWSFLMR